MEIAIDSSHLNQTIRLNFPSDRSQFREQLLSSEENDSQIPAGQKIGSTNHLRIEAADSTPSEPLNESQNALVGSSTPTTSYEPTRLALVSTIQFVAALSRLKDDLTSDFLEPGMPGPAGLIEGTTPSTPLDALETRPTKPKFWTTKYEATIPQSKPLSPGEILGCTAPPLKDVDALMYVFPIQILLLYLPQFLFLIVISATVAST